MSRNDQRLCPRRLIEVDLPIKRISAHARREKSIRHGHISTLHIWWARRPLAACRAVICAALWPDPADPLCPETFRRCCAASRCVSGSDIDLKSAKLGKPRAVRSLRTGPVKAQHNEELRYALLDFIADFANWDNSTASEYLEHQSRSYSGCPCSPWGTPDTQPLVVDPFAGGGAIPLKRCELARTLCQRPQSSSGSAE